MVLGSILSHRPSIPSTRTRWTEGTAQAADLNIEVDMKITIHGGEPVADATRS